MLKDERWQVARLIPISSASGIEAQERRAASALLAVMGAVPEFGRALLRPLGAPAGKIEAFIEAPFKLDGQSLRPDGIVTVTRAGKVWGALLEVKTGTVALDPAQVDVYLDLARELEFDAVATISNQFVTSSAEYPVDVDRRKVRGRALHHWSWIAVLTEAVMQKQHRGISDPDQAYILGELIRYLSDPRSGAVQFESMGPHWTAVRDGARDLTLRKTDPEVGAVAGRWDELVRFLCLEFTKDLGRDVRQHLPSGERTPAQRLQSLRAGLGEGGRLRAEISIPDTVGPLELVADLRARQVTASVRFDAPREGRSRGRVSWLLRQLQDAPEALRVESKAAYASSTLAATLAEARSTPDTLYPDSDREIREFIVSLTRNAGMNRDAGRGSFVESVLTTAKDFYAQVMQNVRAWKAAPPRLAPAPEPAPPPKERIISLSVEVAGEGSPPVAGERGDRGSAAGREA